MRHHLAFTALTCAAVVCGCRQRGDTEGRIEQALRQANIERVEVLADDEAGLVHLSGIVNSPALRSRAEQVAASVVGTGGRVVNDLAVEMLEDNAPADPDAALTHAVDLRLDDDPVLKERDITVAAHAGAVMLIGRVRADAERRHAADVVASVSGVTKVENRLALDAEP